VNNHSRPPHRLTPNHAGDVAEILREANTSCQRCEIIGGGTKRSLGGPVDADLQLDLSVIAGIEMYEPEELVLKVLAGTPVSHLRQVLAERNQHLAFEPPQYAALFGDSTSEDTIGGIVACNLSGPRRVLSGSARDTVLGIEGVNGRGETFKGGGRTVKNVTGYDIPRLLTGSFGVLAVLTSITLNVHPAPTQETTLMLTGLSDTVAIEGLSGALKLPLDISAAIHLSGRSFDSLTAVRLEGFPESVAARERELGRYFEKMGSVTSIGGDESSTFWRRQRDLADFVSNPGDDPEACVWRLLLPATKAARVVAAVRGEVLYDWGGSQVFVKTSADGARSQAASLRTLAGEAGGSACLFKAPAPLRLELGTFQPRPRPHQELAERVRMSFDPKRLLNPGKLAFASRGAA
jgi:glycolate oxidase FAD binding subunit